MPEADTAIWRIPFALTVWTARGHVVANSNEFVSIHQSCAGTVGVNACDAAHKYGIQLCLFKAPSYCVSALDDRVKALGFLSLSRHFLVARPGQCTGNSKAEIIARYRT